MMHEEVTQAANIVVERAKKVRCSTQDRDQLRSCTPDMRKEHGPISKLYSIPLPVRGRG